MKARRIKSLARGLLDGSPAGRSNTRPLGGQVAQLVEQRTENPRVGGSIPPLATIQASTDFYTRLQKPCFIGLCCIPLSTGVPSNPPPATRLWGLFYGLLGGAQLSNPKKTT